MQINGFHHIGLFVCDMDRSYRFYTEGLGGQPTFSFPIGEGREIHLIDLGNNAVVELIPRGAEEPEAHARWAHIALSTDDTRAAYDMAIRAGAISHNEPANQMLGEKAVVNAFVTGPDGEVIEFFQEL